MKSTRMASKLTLSIEKEIIVKAKAFARKSNRSLSDLVSSYLDRITSQVEEAIVDEDLEELVGIISVDQDFDDKIIGRELRIKKHVEAI